MANAPIDGALRNYAAEVLPQGPYTVTISRRLNPYSSHYIGERSNQSANPAQ